MSLPVEEVLPEGSGEAEALGREEGAHFAEGHGLLQECYNAAPCAVMNCEDCSAGPPTTRRAEHHEDVH